MVQLRAGELSAGLSFVVAGQELLQDRPKDYNNHRSDTHSRGLVVTQTCVKA